MKEIIGPNTALIVGVQPVSLGVVEAPGHYGADIVVGEGQPLGSPVTGGGPLYGIFACTKPYLRLMPGRIVGRSIDVDGKEAYCLTLSTREQHIRRHRATSNICTNETLIALMGAMHMALLGPDGLRDLAHRNMMACQKAKEVLAQTPGVRVVHDAHHFNEFAIEVYGSAAECLAYLDSNGIIGGLDLGPLVRRNHQPNSGHDDRPNDTSGYPSLLCSIGHVVVSFGGESMSHLFNHNGAENTGYSQPAPLGSDAKPVVPKGLVRKPPLAGLVFPSPKWCAITRGFPSEISALIPAFTRWARAQ